MTQLRDLCRTLGIAPGRQVTKSDHFHCVCEHLKIATTGGKEDVDEAGSSEKSSSEYLREEIQESYKSLPSFHSITNG